MKPDLILSFSGGRNDMYVPYVGRSDQPYLFPTVVGMVDAIRADEGPEWLHWLEGTLPNIFVGSPLSTAIRLQDMKAATGKALAAYRKENGYGNDTYADVIEPMYLHALKSIKRDFDGIPIAVAFQPLREIPNHKALWQQWVADYRKLRDNVPEKLRGYMNDGWYFLDVHGAFEAGGLNTSEFIQDDCHMSVKGNRAAGEMVADWLLASVPAISNAR